MRLKAVLVPVKVNRPRVSKNGVPYFQPNVELVCSQCGNVVMAPSNNIHYNHCYNCGEKFIKSYGARDMKVLKQEFRSKGYTEK